MAALGPGGEVAMQLLLGQLSLKGGKVTRPHLEERVEKRFANGLTILLVLSREYGKILYRDGTPLFPTQNQEVMSSISPL